DTPERLWEDILRTIPKIHATGGQRWQVHDISELTDIDETVHWIVNSYLYQDSVGTIVGEPSARKSWAALQLSVAVACSEVDALWDQPVLIHGPVLYYNLDDRRPRRLKLRLGNILAYYREGRRDFDIPFKYADGGLDYNKQNWERWMREDLDRMEQQYQTPVILVVIDTMHKAGFNPKDWGAGVQPFLEGLTNISLSKQTAFMLVHHTAKSGDRPENIRISPWGSVFTGASLDPAWRLTRSPSDDRDDPEYSHIYFEAASKEGPEMIDPLLLRYGRDTSKFEVEFRAADIETRILAQLELNSEPLSQAELARRLDVADTQVSRAISRMERRGKVEAKKMGAAKMITLPETSQQSEF
ncbi:hypothetical protein LCGC14_2551050, partial [marine sediment metagenome]